MNQINFDIYPNPTTDFISVNIKAKSTDEIEVRIINSLGQEVFSTHLKGQKQYDINKNTKDWESGIYYVSIESNDEILSKKIIKR